MSYQNKWDEISEKLQKLQSGGGITRPLVPAGEDFASALTRKLDEVTQGIASLKSELCEFRQKTLSQLSGLDRKIKSLTSAKGGSDANTAAAYSGDKAFDSILDEINALKENIKTVLTLEGE